MTSMDTRIQAMDIATGFSSGLSFMDHYNIFTMLNHQGLDYYLYKEDTILLYELATNPKYNIVSNTEKLSVYDQIICPRGFTRTHSGTNRIIYSHNTDNSFIIKVGLDKVGVEDNGREYYNQKVLQPFVPKIFDISKNQAVILMEKVIPIKNKQMFLTYAEDIFNMITYLVGCGYIMEDIGTDFFMNWGIRTRFGPVLLDYPYVYRVNKNRLKCIQRNIDGSQCKGNIVYDDGYNYLVCDICGKRYAAKDIGSSFKYLNEIKSKMKRRATMENLTFSVNRNGVEYEIKTGSSVIDEESSRNIMPKFEKETENKTLSFVTSRHNPIQNDNNTSILNRYINKKNLEAGIAAKKPAPQAPSTNNAGSQIDPKFIKNNNLMISTILKEFGYNTEDISDDLVNIIVEAMKENYHKYIKVANKIELTKELNAMNEKQKAEYEEKIKNILHTNKIRIEENDLITHYYSSSVYYDREQLRDVIREALAKYRVDVHVDETPAQEPVKEEEKVEDTVAEEKQAMPVHPSKMEMKFDSANALGDPVMTAKTAHDDVATQSKINVNNGKLTAADEF